MLHTRALIPSLLICPPRYPPPLAVARCLRSPCSAQHPSCLLLPSAQAPTGTGQVSLSFFHFSSICCIVSGRAFKACAWIFEVFAWFDVGRVICEMTRKDGQEQVARGKRDKANEDRNVGLHHVQGLQTLLLSIRAENSQLACEQLAWLHLPFIDLNYSLLLYWE